MKKSSLAFLISVMLSVLLFGIVSAGVAFDIGTLQGEPAEGLANWTAWIDEPKNIMVAGMPYEILTEDNTNSSTFGVNGGYVYDGVDTTLWIVQVINFDVAAEAHGDTVKMIFGGLGSSPQRWDYAFDWNKNTDSVTDHGEIPASASAEFCPAITSSSVIGNAKTISFSAEPNRTYYVYKSTQGSGHPTNVYSNGRYHYLMTVITNGAGFGTFTDNEPLESWYTVIPADEATGNLGGCHSEEAAPTAVHLMDMNAQLSPSMKTVEVSWQTVSETSVVGFNVYRASSEDGPQQKLNSSTIMAAYPGAMGGSYQFVDRAVTPGQTYYYWVEATGVGETIGPEMVRVPFLFYLPFIMMN